MIFAKRLAISILLPGLCLGLTPASAQTDRIEPPGGVTQPPTLPEIPPCDKNGQPPGTRDKIVIAPPPRGTPQDDASLIPPPAGQTGSDPGAVIAPEGSGKTAANLPKCTMPAKPLP